MENAHVQPLRRIEWRSRVLAAGGAPFLCALVQRGHREETLDDRHDPAFAAWLRGEAIETRTLGQAVRQPEHAEQWAELDATRGSDQRLERAAALLGVTLDAVPGAVQRLESQLRSLQQEAEALRAQAARLETP